MKYIFPRIRAIWSIGLLMVLGCASETKRADAPFAAQGAILCANALLEVDLSKMPAPKRRENVGNNTLSITSKHTEAKQWFNQGLSLLHGFWHIEAYRCFNQVIQFDSTAAMGYWGLAMCQPGFGGPDAKVFTEAIDKSAALASTCTPFEQALIAATQVLIKEGIEKAQQPFRNLYKRFPNEPEAIATASIILRQHQNETTQLEVIQMLENGLKQFPQNTALLHYYVHVMESRATFEQAIDEAERMQKFAPNSPHLVHMPGHLYYLQGNYDKAIAVFEQAQTLETAYHTEEKIPFAGNQNYLHNLHYLTLAFCENNEKEKALATATALSNIQLRSNNTTDGATQMLLYEARILPALVHIRFGEYKTAAEKLEFWLNAPDFPIDNYFIKTYLRVMRLYCLGMHEALASNIDKATVYGGELSKLMYEYEQKGANMNSSITFKYINEAFDIMSMSKYELAAWIDNPVSSPNFNDAAWLEAIDLQNAIQYDEPPRLMYPIEESKARLHKLRKETKLFEAAKANALQVRPKSKRIQNI